MLMVAMTLTGCGQPFLGLASTHHTYPTPATMPVRLAALPLILLVLLFPTIAASAQQPSGKPVATADPTTDDVLVAGGFLEGHPDLRFRNDGLNSYANKEFTKAFEQFKRAAYYADKPSQAVVGEMYWDGIGVAQDRVLGLIWMDLAAERGYDFFSKKRDYYWNSLSEQDRTRALAQARSVHREYADEAAEPRLAAALRRERSKMTGSRVGSLATSVQIIVPGYGSIDSTRFYDPQFWDPKQYRAWQDTYWTDLKVGRVTVGDAEKVQDGGKSSEPKPQTGDTPPL